MPIGLSALCKASGAERFVVLDVETTGLGRSDQVIELGMVTIDPKGSVTERWESLIRPSVPISPAAARVNRITRQMLRGAPTFTDLLPEIARRIERSCIVAHNAAFDTRMLRQDFKRSGSELDPGSPIDTYAVTRKKLEDSLRDFGIRPSGSHRAMADASATAELFLRIAERVSPGRCARVVSRSSPAEEGAVVPRPHHRSPGERVVVTRGRTASPKSRGGGASVDRDDPRLANFNVPEKLDVRLMEGSHVVISTLTIHTRSSIQDHAEQLGLIVKPEVTSTSVLLVTDDLASLSRRAMKARQRLVPLVLARDFLKSRPGGSVQGLREGSTGGR